MSRIERPVEYGREGVKTTDHLEQGRRALDASPVIKMNREEVLGPSAVEQLCRAAEQLGWTIRKRHDEGDHHAIGIEVDGRRYSIHWYATAPEKLILGLDYRLPDDVEELPLRRRVADVEARTWFLKVIPSIDARSINFTCETHLNREDLEAVLRDARMIVDAGAMQFFGGTKSGEENS